MLIFIKLQVHNSLGYFTEQYKNTGPKYKSKYFNQISLLTRKAWELTVVLCQYITKTHVDRFKTEAMVTAQKLNSHWPQANRKSTSSATDIFFAGLNHTICNSAYRFMKF